MNASLFFPTTIQTLDFFHAVEHLGVLARALFGEGEFGKVPGPRDTSAPTLPASSTSPQTGGRLRNGRSTISPPTANALATDYTAKGLRHRQQGHQGGLHGRHLAPHQTAQRVLGDAGAENIPHLRYLLNSPQLQSRLYARRLILATHQSKARR